MLLTVFLFEHYGLSWDETDSRQDGIVTYEYVTGKNQNLLQYPFRFYGTGFELPLVAAKKVFHFSTMREVYLFRHFANATLFFTATIFFYKLLLYIFIDWRLALFGCIMLVVSPRIFAERFYNPRDIPAFCIFIIAMFTLVWFLEKSSIWKGIIHAMISALLVSERMPSVFVPILTVLFSLLDSLFLWSHKKAFLEE